MRCDWSDAELAAIPCAWSTAENMLHRGRVGAGTVLITGASGGVGSSAVQLAKLRGARVIALGDCSVDVVLDLVGGAGSPPLLEVLKKGGRYVIAGAIAAPLAQIDLRTLYLKDLTLFGAAFQEDEVFETLVRHIEGGRIRPVVAGTYPLKDIVTAQKDFLDKGHVGKLVLIPPQENP